jgi:hypothetical protein
MHIQMHWVNQVLHPSSLSRCVLYCSRLPCHVHGQYMMTRLCQGEPNHAPAVVNFQNTDGVATSVGSSPSYKQMLLCSDHRIPRGQVFVTHLIGQHDTATLDASKTS